MIYMDNAATTMHKPQEVIDAVVSAMSSMGNAGRGASEAALSASRIIYDTEGGTGKIVRCRECKADCIYIEFYGKSEYCYKRNTGSGRSCDHNGSGT